MNVVSYLILGKKINNCISQLSGTFCFMESTTGLQRPVSVDTINAGLCFFLLKTKKQTKKHTDRLSIKFKVRW